MENAHYLMKNVIPCALHFENRMHLKIITRLLQIGYKHAREGNILRYDGLTTESRAKKACVQAIQSAINEEILGKKDRPIRWTLPLDKENKNIGTILIDNTRCHKMMSQLTSKLLPLCVPEGENNSRVDVQALWIVAIQHYTESLAILL
jgi:hypothetical protein